jgi:lysophospholipase L1-like esterase
MRTPRIRLLVYSLLPAVLLFATAEIGFRLAGFEYEAAPMTLRFGYPDPREITDLFQPDSELFWRLRPGSDFGDLVAELYDGEPETSSLRINTAGYRGPVASAERADGSLRVAVLGDSVAFGFGSEAWPEILERRLASRLPGRKVEVLNFGVPGYAVVQGARQLDSDVAGLTPDVVVIAYGWNDHWLAKGGLPDIERRLPSAAVAQMRLAVARIRIVQAAHYLLSRAVPPRATDPEERRVSPETFQESLTRMMRRTREIGAIPLAVALPSGLTVEEFPSYLVDGGFTPSASRAIRDHALYAKIIAETARAEGAVFLDLQPVFENDDGTPRAEWLFEDRIHPRDEGSRAMAEAVETIVVELVAASL